jgi:Fe(3+) dicitrate transport protein
VLNDTTTYANEFAYLTGAVDSADDAIIKRHNNREYFSQGVQAKISWDLSLGDAAVALTTGVRLHADEEDRLQRDDGFRIENSILALTSAGAPGSATNRISSAEAISYFVDTEIRTGRWIFTPGIRFEDIDMERLDFSTADPTRAQGATGVRSNSVSVLIPGVGALYALNDNWRILGGIHKGFNPPGPGSSASEEDSINLEFGTRFNNGRTKFEAIYFQNDYDNLVGTVTASTGGTGQIGDQFDGGEVMVRGIELSASTTRRIGDVEIPISLQHTWTTEAEFRNSFDSGFEPWGDVEIGDELPYIPKQQLRATAGLRSNAWGINLAANYVGKMRAVASQGSFEPQSSIDSHLVWDFMARWNWSDSISTYIKLDNLFDETYIASRRPAGVRPGLERTAYAGVTLTL